MEYLEFKSSRESEPAKSMIFANLVEPVGLHEQGLNDLNTKESTALVGKNPSDKKIL